MIDRDGVRVLFDHKLAGELQFAGLAPNFAGLYQINVKIPDDASLAGPISIEIETRTARSSFNYVCYYHADRTHESRN